MKVNPAMYDSSMTVIVLGIAKDGLVIAGDGKAIRTDTNKVWKLDLKKVHHIGNGVLFGASSNSFAPNECDRVQGTLQLNLPLIPPYTMLSIAEVFYQVVVHLYKDEPNDFWIQFGLVGYGRDKDNNITDPELFVFEKKNGEWNDISLVPTEENPVPFGLFGTEKSHEDKVDTVLPELIDELVIYAQEVIKRVEKEDESVGGDIVTITVQGNDWKESIIES